MVLHYVSRHATAYRSRNFRFSACAGEGLRNLGFSALERLRKFRFSEAPGEGLRNLDSAPVPWKASGILDLARAGGVRRRRRDFSLKAGTAIRF